MAACVVFVCVGHGQQWAIAPSSDEHAAIYRHAWWAKLKKAAKDGKPTGKARLV